MGVGFIGVDHIQLAAPRGGEEKARKFWSEVLGCPEIEKPPALKGRGGAWFQVGAEQVHVGIEEGFKAAKKAHPAFQVQEIEEVVRALEQANIPCERDDSLPRAKRFYTEDPFGNRLEFLEWK
ncbi:VOC family protein [Salsuginibacillus kocurii]|uniref:VOC family protein n=1 Tax=Salsuginibacillus kocurii TaxID=427078 RepID=UPI00036DBBF3|nr:VOC family protein [Salsuginibacillus kocurii]